MIIVDLAMLPAVTERLSEGCSVCIEMSFQCTFVRYPLFSRAHGAMSDVLDLQ